MGLLRTPKRVRLYNLHLYQTGSEWETSNGSPGGRVYSLTDAGEEYLEAWAEGCNQYQQVMDAFYRAYADRPPRS